MSASNKEIAEKIVRASDDWNWEGEQFEKYVDAITAALDLKDARIFKLEDALRFYADEMNYGCHGETEFVAIYNDDEEGKRARQALGGE